MNHPTSHIFPLISRRSFLLGMTTTGVGLVLTSSFPVQTAGAVFPTQNTTSFQPNSWIILDPDGTVTITVAKSELGQGIRTSFAMIVAEEMDADWSKVKVRQARPDYLKNGEVIESTSGSNSILLNYESLRKAGATAKAMLISAAAKTWGINAENCSARNGIITEVNGTRTLSYGELTEIAAAESIPNNPPLKDPKDFTLIGSRKPHIDCADIVSGKAKYGLDMRIPGMVYAVNVFPPAFGAFISKIDTSKALAIPGVLKVDLVLAVGYVVLAETTYAALLGRDALIIEWNTDKNSSLNSSEISAEMKARMGELPVLLPNSVTTVEAQYELPYLAHATMEPMNCLADVRETSAEIWCGTQVVDYLRSESAKLLNLPIDKVIVNVPLLGGGFGRRLYIDIALGAVLISKKFKMPVLFMLTRKDDMRTDFYRPASYHACKAGLDVGGNITDIIHYTVNGESNGFPPYAISPPITTNYSIDLPISVGAWRAVGHTSSVFVNESFIDEIAHAAGKDAFEFRRDLLPKDSRMRAVLEKAAELADWYKPLPKGWGRGIACYSWSSDVAHVIEVSVSTLGRLNVERVIAVVDCGVAVNPLGIEAQLQGAIVDGLSTALKSEITIENGRIKQSSFADFGWLRINEMPKIQVHILPGTRPPMGIGEMGFPSVSPALCNALFNATGKRVRSLPIQKSTSMAVESESLPDIADLSVFPNPCSDSCTIAGNVGQQTEQSISISVENILGSTIVRKQIPRTDTGKFEDIIDFPTSSAGVYFLTVTCGDFAKTTKICKE